MIVQTLPQLRELYQVEPLFPFGWLVTARKHRRPGYLSGALLADLLAEKPLLVLRGFDREDREGFLAFCRSYPGAELLHWDHGPVMEMRPDPEARNYLFTPEAVPFHWDGAFHRVPSFLAFHCLRAPAADAGGETLFADTRRLWERGSPSERELWERARLTYRTEKLAHYGGSVTAPLVQRHPRTGEVILRFAEPVSTRLNPVSLEVRGVGSEEGDRLVAHLSRRLYDPEVCYAHAWEDGDYLLADNHALVHGRRAFRSDSPRHLRRIQIL